MPALIFAIATLQDYQIQLPDGSIVGAGANGVSWTSMTGLRSLPSLRGEDVDLPQGDGALPGFSRLGERTIGINFHISASDAGFENAISLLARNWQNIIDPSTVAMKSGSYLYQNAISGNLPLSALQVKLPGRTAPILLLGKPTKFDLPVDLNYQYQFVDIATEWTIPDGAIYDAGIVSGNANLPTSAGGARAPFTFPLSFGGSSGGYINLTNGGNYPAKPCLLIQGPMTRPTITNQATGQYMRLNITLGASDVLTVDMQGKVARLNGVNRNNAIDTGSVFFSLPPGQSSLALSSADSTTVAGTITASLLNTYSVI